MGSLKKILINSDEQDLLSRNFRITILNQLRKASLFNYRSTWLNKSRKALLTSTVAIAILAGANYGKSNRVVAQKVSATWAETTSLTSILTGYESILLGLEEVGADGELTVFDHSLIFKVR